MRTFSSFSNARRINEKVAKERRKTFAEIITEYGMSDEQVAFYQQYSMERSAYRYERNAAKQIGDSNIEKDWKYLGYRDAGYMGADHCTNGHALRYVHLAKNIKTGEVIKFGIKCVSDFFHLTEFQLKLIRQGFNEANKEITEAIDKFVRWNGDVEAYEKRFGIFEKFTYVMSREPSTICLSWDKFENMMKIAEMRTIFELKLFLPSYWERVIRSAFNTVKYKEAHGYYDKNDESADDTAENTTETINTSTNTIVNTTTPVQAQPQQNLEQVLANKIAAEKAGFIRLYDNANRGLSYAKVFHTRAFDLAFKFYRKGLTNLTHAQRKLFDKLVSTKWQKIDKVVDGVNDKIYEVKPNYRAIYKDLTGKMDIYGMSDKQIELLEKCVTAVARASS